jgi:hypothetical protein
LTGKTSSSSYSATALSVWPWLDWKARNAKTVYKMHHPEAEIDRLFLKKGRRRKRPVTN